ncbi:MAG: hypothetical protein U0835_17515 [Isosphaeraceae bacterium]
MGRQGRRPVALPNILCKDLSGWARPPAGKVAVDVRLGRIAFATGEEPARVDVRYHHGFSADVGGGPYDRRRGPGEASDDPDTVARPDAYGPPIRVPSSGIDTLADALAAWKPDEQPRVVFNDEQPHV